ncbi:hypothetical protein H4R34_002900 [Dimargaris verticillata]|uniref:Uncharacterized protein n=1 Tax=Dimargaris verticillata TaxID=2761393 RepID=A0A9W8B378_9FUNG|nr:hypothetical protein H4R34_002900 [Dimargaris verticillata]
MAAVTTTQPQQDPATLPVGTVAQTYLTWLKQGEYDQLYQHSSEILSQRVQYLGDPASFSRGLSPHDAETLDNLFQWQLDDAAKHLRQLPLAALAQSLASHSPRYKRVDAETLLCALPFSETPRNCFAVVLLWEKGRWKYHNLQQFSHPELFEATGAWAASTQAAENRFTARPMQQTNFISGDDSADSDGDYWAQYDDTAGCATPGLESRAQNHRSAEPARSTTAAEDRYWLQYDEKLASGDSTATDASNPQPPVTIEDATSDASQTAPSDPSSEFTQPTRIVTSALTFNQESVSPVELIYRLNALHQTEEAQALEMGGGASTPTLSAASPLTLPKLEPNDVTMAESESQSSVPEPALVKPAWRDAATTAHAPLIRDNLRSLYQLASSLGLSAKDFVSLAREATEYSATSH